MLELILIKPEKYKVARVITFKDNFNNLSGTICYMRPLSNSYNKETLDDFDNSMLIWLQSFNLKNVKLIYSTNIIFNNQISQLNKAYNGGRPHNDLSFICYGNYPLEEFVTMKQINAINIKLKVFWNTTSNNSMLPILNGVVSFDKNKEKYYFDTIKSVTSL